MQKNVEDLTLHFIYKMCTYMQSYYIVLTYKKNRWKQWMQYQQLMKAYNNKQVFIIIRYQVVSA